MELFGKARTVRDLIKFLDTIPEGQWDLPITVLYKDSESRYMDYAGPISLAAFSVLETEGCREEGFTIEAYEEE